jgi:hypothetical protein
MGAKVRGQALDLPTCAACKGLVFIPPQRVDHWPTECPCKGRKRVSFAMLARKLGWDRRTLIRIHAGRARPETAADFIYALPKQWLEGDFISGFPLFRAP